MKIISEVSGTSKNETTMTDREWEILEMLSLGLSTSEIAQQLFLSFETIRSYRKSLLQKLGARNTANLMRIAFEGGWLKAE